MDLSHHNDRPRTPLRLRKSLGQHLLVDSQYLKRIAAESGITEEDRVFEIGPGTGNLTREILSCAGSVLAIELDRRFSADLEGLGAAWPGKLQVIYGDVLEIELPSLLDGLPGWKVLANIPYYITSPILTVLLRQGGSLFSDIFLTVQKEIAERLCAEPGSADFSSLSLFVGYHAVPRYLFTIPPSAFRPPPLVHSAFVHLKVRDRLIASAPYDLLFRIIHHAFGQKRKGIKNSLKKAFPSLSPSEITEGLEQCGIDPLLRPQNISIQQFDTLALHFGRLDKGRTGKK
jgi:16S rRNA (adenine1518-N6/adenine1519-N6)-dimethyltransferase